MFWKQRTAQEHVDIITFYNEIFIPAVKSLLVELGPAGTTIKTNRVPEVNNNNDGTLLFQIYM
jgi:retinoblastoma-like protein 1